METSLQLEKISQVHEEFFSDAVAKVQTPVVAFVLLML